jgi:hypothetical protein
MNSLWGFREARVARSLVFCALCWEQLFFIFFFFCWLLCFSVLQFTDSDDHFGIFKLFFIYGRRVSLADHIRFLSVLSWVRIARSLVFCVVFCRSMIVPLSPFALPLCCLYLCTNSDHSLSINKQTNKLNLFLNSKTKIINETTRQARPHNCLPVPSNDLDFQCHMSLSVWCSMICG